MNERTNETIPEGCSFLLIHLPSRCSSFFVGQDGAVYEGVGWTVQGSHTRGYNDIALGIAFLGTFSGKRALWAGAATVWGLRESV